MTCTHGWKGFTVADGCGLNWALDSQFRGSDDTTTDGLWTDGVLSPFQELSHSWAQEETSALSVFISLALRCTVTWALLLYLVNTMNSLIGLLLAYLLFFLYIAMYLRPWIYNSMIRHENKDFWLPVEIRVTEGMWIFCPVWSTSTRDE